MKSKYGNFVGVDTETGGLPNKSKAAFFDVALTEIAMVAVSEDLEIIDKKSWLVKPYKEGLEYNPEAAKVSGITKEMCEEKGQDIQLVCKEVIQFLKKHKNESRLPVLFGHNFISFDIPFILNMFEYCKEDLTKYANPEPEDTLKWSRMRWKELTNYKLGTVCEAAGITHTEAHRALPDTIVTSELFIYFMKGLRREGIVEQKKEKRFRQTFEL